MAGYSLENQKKLWDLHNSLLEDLLSSFPNEEISSLKELRKAVFFNLFQNNSTSFQTHTEVLFNLVSDNIQPRHFNKLPLSRLTDYLQEMLSIALSTDTKDRVGNTAYDMVHHSDNDIASFYRNNLKPLLEVLDDNFDIGFQIPKDIQGTDVLSKKQVVKLYDDLHEFAKFSQLTINDIKILDNEKLLDVLEPLIQELFTVELGGMYAAVPGTEGMRPAVNVVVALHDSLDELFESMDKIEKLMLADKFEFFAINDTQHEKVLLKNYTGKEKEFIKDKIFSFLEYFTEQSNGYLEGEGGFVGNFAYDRPSYFENGTGIRTKFREMFVKEIIETGLVDIDILIRNSPEPISLLTSLDDAHRAFQIDINFPPYVSSAVINRLNEIAGLSTEGAVEVEKIYRPGYEGMTIGEVLAETLRYPQRPDFQDIDPVIKKLNKYDKPIGSDGTDYLIPIEEEGVLQLDDDIVTYHSRPNSQGELPSDANFHTGTYQAALDRASYKYEGKYMYEMLGETLNELNELINSELANFTIGESDSISVTADFGTENNSSVLSAEITWDADNEELNIQLFDEDDYFERYPELSEGYDITGYSSDSTVADLVGEIRIQDYAEVDNIMQRMPISPGDEFDFAKGYSLYEVTIPKDAKILSLDQPILIEQKGKEISLTADALQDIVEKGFNQPTSSSVYSGVDAITIGNKRLEIPAGLSKNEIQELLFGEYDVIAYTNDIEDVGSISYIVKPNAATVRLIKGAKNNLFNNRVLREYMLGNPFMFTEGSFFDNDRKIRNIVNSISDKARRYSVNTILENFNKKIMGREITSSEQGNYDRLFYDVLYSEGLDNIPTNVVDDFYVVTPEQLSEAIDLMKEANEGEIFETHNQLISELKEWIFQDLGFDAGAEGTVADLDTVLDDWLTSQGTFEDTKFFNNFPKIENLPDPKNVRGLVAAAGGPENIKEGYVQPQYFKDKPNVPYVVEDTIDTPTNVVDDLEDAIIKSDGLDSLNKSKEIINKNPRIFSKVLSVLEKFDVGDQVIQQVIKRALPRIGLSAAAGPLGIAYAVYETSLLLMDAANAVYKAETTDEGFWDNFGEVSDKYSIAYKITKPTYDLLLDAIKADLEDNNTLYSFSR